MDSAGNDARKNVIKKKRRGGDLSDCNMAEDQGCSSGIRRSRRKMLQTSRQTIC